MKDYRTLFYAHIVGIVAAVLSTVTGVTAIQTWGNRVVAVVIAITLFRLCAYNKRYKKAAIFLCVSLGCSLVNIIGISLLLSAIGSVCSLIAVYQEYTAHGEMCREEIPVLERKWHSLFFWQLVVGIIMGFAGSAAALIYAMVLNGEPESFVTILLAVFNLVDIILKIFYLRYMKQMWELENTREIDCAEK